VRVTVQRGKEGVVTTTLVRGGRELWRAWDAADAAQREAAAREGEAAGLRQRLDAAEARNGRLAARNASDEALVPREAARRGLGEEDSERRTRRGGLGEEPAHARAHGSVCARTLARTHEGQEGGGCFLRSRMGIDT
jgi:hypothetical protein